MTLYKDDYIDKVWILYYHSHDYYEGWEKSCDGVFKSVAGINKKLGGKFSHKHVSDTVKEWRLQKENWHDSYYSAELVKLNE